MIEFCDFRIVREGVCFDAIEKVFNEEFGVELLPAVY